LTIDAIELKRDSLQQTGLYIFLLYFCMIATQTYSVNIRVRILWT